MPIKYVIATLDPTGPIKEFFDTKGVTTTQAACDALARQITGAEVSPVKDQGTCSYTVEAKSVPPVIVQFREGYGEYEKIDLNLYERARQVYGDLVPKCQHHGEIGGLQVYAFDKLPGVSISEHMLSTDLSEEENKLWRTHLAEGLAQFFAKGWNNGLIVAAEDLKSMRQHSESHLDTISSLLPSRYAPLLAKLKSVNFLDGDYPIVPAHNDFATLNMFVESSTGKLTGVIDWTEANLSPFGYSIYGAEEACYGWMGPRGWTYYAWHAEVRDAFWTKFEQLTGVSVGSEMYERIMAARHIGMLLRYGFHWSTDEKKEICEPRMEYLDALLADNLAAETGAKA